MRKTVVLQVVIALAVLAAVPAAAQVSMSINVGPPIIFPAPPRVVVIPQSPVTYVPDTTYNVFVYGGRYYSFHEGAWFMAPSHGGPWAFVPVEQVPRPVIGVPVRYYKVPPGHARRGEREEGREHGRGGCPPGLAKQGRC
jgi:hypothetical protein